jgi:hypothetical protein
MRANQKGLFELLISFPYNKADRRLKVNDVLTKDREIIGSAMSQGKQVMVHMSCAQTTIKFAWHTPVVLTSEQNVRLSYQIRWPSEQNVRLASTRMSDKRQKARLCRRYTQQNIIV